MAVKVGKPAARQVAQKDNETLCSDCPLACKHLGQLLVAVVDEVLGNPAIGEKAESLCRISGIRAPGWGVVQWFDYTNSARRSGSCDTSQSGTEKTSAAGSCDNGLVTLSQRTTRS